MIDIKDAIELSKTMPNISDGGSACFDFGDVVLVKYTLSLEYVTDSERARRGQEQIMESINKKVDIGVNTPRQYSMQRVVEDDMDVCYVLQQKCPGINCSHFSEYGASYSKVMSDLERVNNIPFEHIVKLMIDGCNLSEMGYEKKNKNLFYDEKTGFWFIDFLETTNKKPFDPNNPILVFETIKFSIPLPRQIASYLDYQTVLTEQEQASYDILENSIKAKTFLAMKKVIPILEKYEKFYLYTESEQYKNYLMSNNIVQKDLSNLEDADYETYDELYDIVVNQIVEKIIREGVPLWSVEINEIRNNSELFNLIAVWEKHRDNQIRREDYEDDYDYEQAVRDAFKDRMLRSIKQKLESIEPNENVKNFLEEMSSIDQPHSI